jgi:hypothetical protein
VKADELIRKMRAAFDDVDAEDVAMVREVFSHKPSEDEFDAYASAMTGILNTVYRGVMGQVPAIMGMVKLRGSCDVAKTLAHISQQLLASSVGNEAIAPEGVLEGMDPAEKACSAAGQAVLAAMLLFMPPTPAPTKN